MSLYCDRQNLDYMLGKKKKFLRIVKQYDRRLTEHLLSYVRSF